MQELGFFVYLSEIGKQLRRSEILNKNECVAYLQRAVVLFLKLGGSLLC